jgi:hypothetical protein
VVQIPELGFLGLWDGMIYFFKKEVDGSGKLVFCLKLRQLLGNKESGFKSE